MLLGIVRELSWNFKDRIGNGKAVALSKNKHIAR